MNANREKLALRRHSIRTLTADDLSIAHGGGEGHYKTRTKTRPPTLGATDLTLTRTVA